MIGFRAQVSAFRFVGCDFESRYRRIGICFLSYLCAEG